jgi:hypothetical protein
MNAYIVDSQELKSWLGSGDKGLAKRARRRAAVHRAQVFSRAPNEPTLDAALQQLILSGWPAATDFPEPFVLALEVICEELGRVLPNDQFRTINWSFIEVLGTVVERFMATGAPFGLPCHESAVVCCHLTHDEAVSQLSDMQPSASGEGEPEVASGRRQFRSWLEATIAAKRLLVAFYY